jgi:hypothetical protein
LPPTFERQFVFLADGQRAEATSVKHQRGNVRCNTEKFDPEKDKLMIAGHHNSIDRAFEPGRRAANEQGIRWACLPIDAGEPVPGLGGQLPANVTVCLS